mgnify:CR=1 FL=1|jgi:hypothetical protein|tara:strand:+ start:10186 stop:10344 length:159 start_codon:yes stop_codon:yes gene_type:complete
MKNIQYIKIAEIISRHPETSTELLYDLAAYFVEDNPNFSAKRFITACGVVEC